MGNILKLTRNNEMIVPVFNISFFQVVKLARTFLKPTQWEDLSYKELTIHKLNEVKGKFHIFPFDLNSVGRLKLFYDGLKSLKQFKEKLLKLNPNILFLFNIDENEKKFYFIISYKGLKEESQIKITQILSKTEKIDNLDFSDQALVLNHFNFNAIVSNPNFPYKKLNFDGGKMKDTELISQLNEISKLPSSCLSFEELNLKNLKGQKAAEKIKKIFDRKFKNSLKQVSLELMDKMFLEELFKVEWLPKIDSFVNLAQNSTNTRRVANLPIKIVLKDPSENLATNIISLNLSNSEVVLSRLCDFMKNLKFLKSLILKEIKCPPTYIENFAHNFYESCVESLEFSRELTNDDTHSYYQHFFINKTESTVEKSLKIEAYFEAIDFDWIKEKTVFEDNLTQLTLIDLSDGSKGFATKPFVECLMKLENSKLKKLEFPLDNEIKATFSKFDKLTSIGIAMNSKTPEKFTEIIDEVAKFKELEKLEIFWKHCKELSNESKEKLRSLKNVNSFSFKSQLSGVQQSILMLDTSDNFKTLKCDLILDIDKEIQLPQINEFIEVLDFNNIYFFAQTEKFTFLNSLPNLKELHIKEANLNEKVFFGIIEMKAFLNKLTLGTITFSKEFTGEKIEGFLRKSKEITLLFKEISDPTIIEILFEGFKDNQTIEFFEIKFTRNYYGGDPNQTQLGSNKYYDAMNKYYKYIPGCKNLKNTMYSVPKSNDEFLSKTKAELNEYFNKKMIESYKNT